MTPFQERSDYFAWGRAHRFTHHVTRPAFADELPRIVSHRGGRSLLARGLGRSYGDSGLNADNALIDMSGVDHIISFDSERGVIEAEAGATLADILALTALPAHGSGKWFLPVSPGTKFVTLGGAIANDVHGKNHHAAGCFGNHVVSLRLLRSDGQALTCSPQENTDLFRATIGGLGLTGLIVSAQIALKAVPSQWMEHEDIRYGSLDAFDALAVESTAGWEYTAAWVDCLAPEGQLGRGIFSRSRHTSAPPGARTPKAALTPKVALPASLPNFVLNNATISAFNTLYWNRARQQSARRIVSFETSLYPLDGIGRWNLMYGRRGFFQFQCVIPTATARDAIRALLEEIRRAGAGSFLAVLKTFGDKISPGMLSFPMAGTTLALDFPNEGERTLNLLTRLDRITTDAQGRIYAAKDGRVSAADFQRGNPAWAAFARHVDPAFSSSFWRRVSADGTP